MKRTMLVLAASAMFSFVAAAFAADIDLKTSDGVQKFWQEQQVQGGG